VPRGCEAADHRDGGAEAPGREVAATIVPAGGGDADAGTITIPPGFTIRTQVFRDGPEFEIPVLLRYRVKDGHPEWMFKFTGEASKIFDDAFDNMTSEIAVGTGLPVYRGSLR